MTVLSLFLVYDPSLLMGNVLIIYATLMCQGLPIYYTKLHFWDLYCLAECKWPSSVPKSPKSRVLFFGPLPGPCIIGWVSWEAAFEKGMCEAGGLLGGVFQNQHFWGN